EFKDDYVINLEENFRSTKTIVSAATRVIQNNTERKDKTLFTNNDPGDRILVREEKSEYDEARWVVRRIEQMMAEGEGSYSDYAIFYRTNAQSRVIEEQLRTHGLPYKIVGGVRFYERMEIKDILGYLKLSLNPSDDMAFKRVVNTPARGIGKTTVEKIEAISIEQKVSMIQAAQWATENRTFNSATTSKVRNFLLLMDSLREQATDLNLLDFYQVTLERTEYVQRLKTEESPESAARIENLEELSNAMSQFMKEREDGGLQSFLEEMALVSDVDSLDEDQNSVTLMTLHVSKGLEYPYVFMVGLEENLFPSFRADEEDDGHSFEEERRLCYVGMTRARQKLHMTYARSRKVWGQEQFNAPSRFLKEIPTEFVHLTTALEMPRFVSQAASRLGSSERSWQDKGFNDRKRSNASDFDSQDFPDYDDSMGGSLAKGMKVRHPTFGIGTVFQTEGDGEQQKVSVLFSDQTIKKFVAKYARLERMS
ncbi:MAG: ATP-dependent helicase, partial [Bdellovibrio sp.]